MSKNLLVLGGSGRTGAHVLAYAAQRGHHVRALVRDPDRVQAPAGVDNARASDNPWARPVSPPMFMTTAARHTLTVMGEQGIRRIVLTSTQGAGDDWARLNPLVRAFIRLSNIRTGFEDHTGVDRVVRAASGIDWTLARAVTLTDKPAGGHVRAAEAGTEKPGARINRADLARFLVRTIEDDAWIRAAPLVWNTRG
jgi:uncharacterized protein YbjT (DUF2867 family)